MKIRCNSREVSLKSRPFTLRLMPFVPIGAARCYSRQPPKCCFTATNTAENLNDFAKSLAGRLQGWHNVDNFSNNPFVKDLENGASFFISPVSLRRRKPFFIGLGKAKNRLLIN
jgi:hypothetical protein